MSYNLKAQESSLTINHFLLNFSWIVLRIIPILLIIWHGYLIGTTDPGAFAIGWWWDLIWISLFGFSLYFVFNPSPKGHLYLMLLFSAYVGVETWNSYLMLDEWRLAKYNSFQLFPIMLLVNCKRFSLSRRGIIVSLIGLCLLNGLQGSWLFDILKYKSMPAVSQWMKPVDTQQVIEGPYIWVNDSIIAGEVNRTNEVNPAAFNSSELTIIDLNTFSSKVINSLVFDISAINDGQRLAYRRFIDTRSGKIQYWRYNTLTGQNEMLVNGINRSDMLYPMSPRGVPVVFQDTKTPQTNREVLLWPRIERRSNGAWSPAGDALLVLEEDRPQVKEETKLQIKDIRLLMTRRLVVYSPEGERKSTIPLPALTLEVKKIQFNPEGTRIYMQVSFGNGKPGLCFYDLTSPSNGWQVILEEVLYDNWSVGPNGKIVYYYYRYEPRHLRSLSRDRLSKVGIWLYDPEVGYPVRLTGRSDFQPAFSPDGSTIAFLHATEYLQNPHLMLMKIKQ